jgi:hypothetical protein
VAAAYATATNTWSSGESVTQWLDSFSTLVTPAFWSAFTSADPAPPALPTRAVVQRVLAAHAPRGEVGAEVLLRITPGDGRALLVDLVERKSMWLVAGYS